MQNQNSATLNPSLEHFDQLPDNAIIRPKPSAILLGVSIATFWRLVASGQIKTHRITERTTTVKVGDLRAFIANKIKP